MVKIQIEIINRLGSFKSDIREINESNLQEFKNISRDFYKSGLEIDLEDGSFVVFSPLIISESIFKINVNV